MFDLAIALGKTVQELEQSLSSSEFTEWMAYFSLQPFGHYREDLRTGILASLIANIHKDKSRANFKPRDFMPFVDNPDDQLIEPRSAEEEAALVEGFINSLGMKVIEKID